MAKIPRTPKPPKATYIKLKTVRRKDGTVVNHIKRVNEGWKKVK